MIKILFAAWLNSCLLCAYSLPEAGMKTGFLNQRVLDAGNGSDTTIEKGRIYCSPYAETRYRVQVRKDKLKITRFYREYRNVFNGKLKNGKIYSDDPAEKGFKPVWGRYYKLGKNSFSVLNIENGEYEQFTLCKE